MTEEQKITIATNLWYIEWACAEVKMEADIYEAVDLIRKTLNIDQ